MSLDSFDRLLEKHWSHQIIKNDKILEGELFRIDSKFMTLHIGEKSQIRIPLISLEDDFSNAQIGDSYLVRFNDSLEDKDQLPHYSITKKETKKDFDEIWKLLSLNRKQVHGIILNEVKGGYSVGVSGIVGFLPQSQIIIPNNIEKNSSFLNSMKVFSIISLDPKNKNIVLSRLQPLESYQENSHM